MGLFSKKTKLKDADINKVDFVPAGAQADAKISIFKSEDGTPEETVGFWEHVVDLFNIMKTSDKEMIQGAVDHFGTSIISEDIIVEKALPKKMGSGRMKALKVCMKELTSLMIGSEEDDEESEESCEKEKCGTGGKLKSKGGKNKMGEINKSELAQDVQDYILDLETKIAKSAEIVTPVVVIPAVEDIYKGLPESVAKMLKDQNDQIKSANEQIAKMRDESDNKVYIAKAADLTSNLGVKAEEFGPVLKAVNDANPELAQKIEAVIKAANEAVKQGDLFKEVGSNTNSIPTGIAKSDAWSQIETLAAGLVTKGASKSTASAIDEVLKSAEGRKLYAIYTGKIKG